MLALCQAAVQQPWTGEMSAALGKLRSVRNLVKKILFRWKVTVVL